MHELMQPFPNTTSKRTVTYLLGYDGFLLKAYKTAKRNSIDRKMEALIPYFFHFPPEVLGE